MTLRRVAILRRQVQGDMLTPNTHELLFSGYHGDVNATYPVGKIDEDSARLIRTTRESLDEAIKMCKPGALFRDIGKVMYGCFHWSFFLILV